MNIDRIGSIAGYTGSNPFLDHTRGSSAEKMRFSPRATHYRRHPTAKAKERYTDNTPLLFSQAHFSVYTL